MVIIIIFKNRFFLSLTRFLAPDWPIIGDNYVNLSKIITEDQNDWIRSKSENFFKKISDFGGGDGLSNRFFERFHTFPYFLRLDSDRTGQGLQFAPYDSLGVDWGQKLLRNYEKFMTKS